MRTSELEKIALIEARKQGKVDESLAPITTRNDDIGSIRFTFSMMGDAECIVTLDSDTGDVEDLEHWLGDRDGLS